ncbi:hypothetical protein U1Q18_052009, partial [Sarracenia purpurea var. burkii]
SRANYLWFEDGAKGGERFDQVPTTIGEIPRNNVYNHTAMTIIRDGKTDNFSPLYSALVVPVNSACLVNNLQLL